MLLLPHCPKKSAKLCDFTFFVHKIQTRVMLVSRISKEGDGGVLHDVT